MASFGILPNMILYLTRHYGMETPVATNVILLWSAATNFTPILGAFLADSYFGRYPTIVFGLLLNLLGMLLFWLTTMIPNLSPCDPITMSCNSPTTSQLAFLYSSLCLISIGAGGVRASSLAFGIDQLNKEKDAGIIEGYFNWTYALTAAAVLTGMTVLAYIQEIFGWMVGFGVPVVFMFISMVSFFLGSSLYVKVEPKGNVISEFARVVIASYRNRNLKSPSPDVFNDGMYFSDKDSAKLMPTDKFRFLNKACLIKNPQDYNQDGELQNQWSHCTIDQVEAFKAMIKIIPIWITGMIMYINMSQGTFYVLEASSMNRHITSNFEIPAASVATFMVLFTVLWLVLYDCVLIPSASKLRRSPTRLRVKQKMGIGLLAICFSTASLAIVEGKRRKLAIDEGFIEFPQGVVNMSVMWLLPRQILDGFAEAFNGVGQNEFYICELPQSMSSVASTLSGLGMSIGNVLASLILSVVDNVTKGEGKESWVSSNINKGHYDYYYWLLFVLMLANFLGFLWFSKAYGPCKGEENEGQQKMFTKNFTNTKKMLMKNLIKPKDPDNFFTKIKK
ncbi:putative proton-dependent oligopeptide transporter family, major facilitator superfamily [Medicago truncatula]|uniref:Putative proton-dependent oligopeptide transporter family, major facilitator superfamily n=1 Tax=Medicago truncatula TaxID=3880 RepID=A0A396JN65_MEDTR|nr:putative proton-dependent oligopeptide transporter family, major facilitator superfamily [Medicago truncatula]